MTYENLLSSRYWAAVLTALDCASTVAGTRRFETANASGPLRENAVGRAVEV